MARILVQSEPFDFAAQAAGFAQGLSGVGAIVTFCGIVRDTPDGDNRLLRMEIEHYPAMTQAALASIAADAGARWSLADCLIIHRYGPLLPGEVIMMVATASAHRADAFAAADFLMDYLKSRAPFWKKEVTQSNASWVSARDEDEAALQRWSRQE